MYRPTKLDLPLIGDIGRVQCRFESFKRRDRSNVYRRCQADPLPTNLRLGLGYRILEDEYNQMTAALDFQGCLSIVIQAGRRMIVRSDIHILG